MTECCPADDPDRLTTGEGGSGRGGRGAEGGVGGRKGGGAGRGKPLLAAWVTGCTHHTTNT